MFLTTVRVRRLRRKTLDELGINPGTGSISPEREYVEVMAHSHVVAIVDVAKASEGRKAASNVDAVVWIHDGLDDPKGVLQAACGALVVMHSVKAAGLTDRAEAA